MEDSLESSPYVNAPFCRFPQVPDYFNKISPIAKKESSGKRRRADNGRETIRPLLWSFRHIRRSSSGELAMKPRRAKAVRAPLPLARRRAYRAISDGSTSSADAFTI